MTVLIEANAGARHNSTGVKWGLGSTASANLQRHDVTGETSFFAKVDFVWTKEMQSSTSTANLLVDFFEMQRLAPKVASPVFPKM